MYLSTAVAHAIAAVVRRHGGSPEELYRRSAIGADLLDDPTSLVAMPDFERLVRAGYELTGDPALGLSVGELAPVGMLHLVGHILHSSTTLRDAFAMFRRFAPVIDQDGQYELLEGGDLARFSFAPGNPDPEMRRFRVEVCLGFTYRVARQLLGLEGTATEVRFEYPAPAYAAAYARIFECPLRFEANDNAILFAREVLDEKLLLGHPALAESLRVRVEELMARHSADDNLPGRITRMLHNEVTLDGVDAASIARKLTISPRTLRRRLSEHDSTFSALLDDVRRERALSALALPGANLKEIAEALGFSEASALHRAFKRWTGQTIGDYRHGRD